MLLFSRTVDSKCWQAIKEWTFQVKNKLFDTKSFFCWIEVLHHYTFICSKTEMVPGTFSILPVDQPQHDDINDGCVWQPLGMW